MGYERGERIQVHEAEGDVAGKDEDARRRTITTTTIKVNAILLEHTQTHALTK